MRFDARLPSWIVSFHRKNINCSIDESLERFREVCNEAALHSIPVRG